MFGFKERAQVTTGANEKEVPGVGDSASDIGDSACGAMRASCSFPFRFREREQVTTGVEEGSRCRGENLH